MIRSLFSILLASVLALPAYAEITNISTRGLVGSGDDKMIAGFTITGTVAEKVFIGAFGESLTEFGVSNIVTDPKVTVFSGDTVVSENDDWDSTSNEINLTTLIPTGDRESAFVLTLNPGSYTVVVEAVGATEPANALVVVQSYNSALIEVPETQGQQTYTGSYESRYLQFTCEYDFAIYKVIDSATNNDKYVFSLKEGQDERCEAGTETELAPFFAWLSSVDTSGNVKLDFLPTFHTGVISFVRVGDPGNETINFQLKDTTLKYISNRSVGSLVITEL